MSLRERLRHLDPQGRALPDRPRPVAPHRRATGTVTAFDLREVHCAADQVHGDVVLDPNRVDARALGSLAKTAGLARYPVDGWVFLDTETTGLNGGAGTVAFLIGLGAFEGDHFVVRQYVMRDYPEEPAMLAAVDARLQQCTVLVTYNGKSFDVPLLRDRFVMHRRHWPLEATPHVDLLHTVRRVWRPRLRDASLGTVERHLFGLGRQDDLPGAQIPGQYFRALREQNAALLDPILEHNATDILSLAALAVCVSAVGRDPLHAPAVELEDLVHVGRTLEAADQADARAQAAACYARAAESPVAETAEDARWRLARLAKRRADWPAAEQLWQQLLSAEWSLAFSALEELAKLYEHRRKDFAAAEGWCRRALDRLERTGTFTSGAPAKLAEWEARFAHRLARVTARRARARRRSQ